MIHTAEYSPTSLIREALSSRSDRALSALESRTYHSWLMALDRAKVLPETAVELRASSPRLFIRAGAGARVTDVDGTSFIDLDMGDGAQILGHAHPAVQQAIVAQAERGWLFGLPGDGQLELARLIQAAGAANERVALCNTVNEAAAYAIHAARTFAGKTLIATFTGSPAGDAYGLVDETAAALPYGHPAAFDQILRRRHDLAAVIVEPVRGADPNLDRTTWLHNLVVTCRELGILMIFDEALSGFRLAYGGVQEMLGLMPDLVIYGNAVGGGLPLAAVAGRADVMAAPAGAYPGGAFSGSPLSVTAGTATLGYLLANRATLYPALNTAGRHLADTFNDFAAAEQFPVQMRVAGSLFRIHFGRNDKTAERIMPPAYPAAAEAFNLLVLSRGVLLQPSLRGFLSSAHTGADLELVRLALTESLRDVRDDGLFSHLR
jgi:glutamate-1-semialdehyde 2,1-aminomutase